MVEDDEDRELAPPSYSVLGRLAEVAGAVVDGDGGAAGHLELGDDVVVEKVVEASGYGVAPGQAALQFGIGAQQPFQLVVELGLGYPRALA